MTHENKALIRRWFQEVWNEGREATIDELVAPECVAHGLKQAEESGLVGPAAFKEFYHPFHGAFPDIHIEIEEVIAEGDLVVARYVVRGSHTGDTLGQAATNRRVQLTGISIARIRDGQIVEAWNNVDLLTLYQQIDALAGMQKS